MKYWERMTLRTIYGEKSCLRAALFYTHFKDVIGMEIIIAIIGSGALSAIISGLFGLAQTKKAKKNGVTAGVQQLLYDRIKFLCKAHLERGYIATNDLDDLERMHKIYHDDLDGNGFLDDLMAAVRRLDVDPVLPKKANEREESK